MQSLEHSALAQEGSDPVQRAKIVNGAVSIGSAQRSFAVSRLVRKHAPAIVKTTSALPGSSANSDLY
jgi:hypothetical protein